MCRVNLAFLTAGVFLVLASSTLAQTPPGQANLVHVEIGGLRNDKGKVMCALFSSANDFPKHADKAIMRSMAAIADGHAVCEFSGVAPGTYAVSVIHDENSNGRLDTNVIGIPARAWGRRITRKVISGHPNSMPLRFDIRAAESS